jgi:ATP-dependent exoDNAse (exonuclease V) beta subunit
LVGVAVHRTIELCLGDPPLELDAAWAQACDEPTAAGPDPRAAPSARRSYLRLQRRLPELVEYVSQREPTEILREHVLTSADGVINGQIDLLLIGARPSVVDHKTGVVLADGLPRQQYERQLALYAWLVDAALGIEVNDAALFSLRDGVVEVDVSRGIREETAAEALRARAECPQPWRTASYSLGGGVWDLPFRGSV